MQRALQLCTGGHKNDRDASVAGIAPGSEGEDMSAVYQEVCNLGYTPRLFDDYISMLDEVKPDIAVINCFWTSCQGDDASTEKEIHAFVEKPVATTFEELEELKDSYSVRAHILRRCLESGIIPIFIQPGIW